MRTRTNELRSLARVLMRETQCGGAGAIMAPTTYFMTRIRNIFR